MKLDKRFDRWVLALCLGALLGPGELLACRYNVRDVGFVDLEGEPYHLYGFNGDQTPAELVSLFRDRCAAAFPDSNVTIETVQVGQQKDHPALKFLPAG